MTSAKAALIATGCLVSVLSLGGCAQLSKDPTKGTAYAPGVDTRKEGVDAAVVGNRLLANKQYQLALDAYTRAALKHGFTGEIYAGLGAANYGLGRLGQAEKQLRKAVTYPEAPPEAWNNLGLVLLDQGETPEAIEMLRRAFALSNGENDEIRENLRLALAMQGKTVYDAELEQDLGLVRSGKNKYKLRKTAP
jgi:Flp pilus assembly protein TadD